MVLSITFAVLGRATGPPKRVGSVPDEINLVVEVIDGPVLFQS
jgi:hypothetical protein